MTRTKEDRNLAASLRDLAALGSPVDLSVAEADVEIEQDGGLCETKVFHLEDGRAGYLLDLLITNQMPRPFHCRDVKPRMPWPDSEFEWLQDPKETERDPHNYRFPGRAALELPRNLVLNHVLLDRILKPGCPKRGCLLGIGSPMPANLRHGAWLEMTLAIVAYDHAEYPATITLWVDRSTKLTRKSATKVPRESLLAKDSPLGPASPNLGVVEPILAGQATVPRQDAEPLSERSEQNHGARRCALLATNRLVVEGR